MNVLRNLGTKGENMRTRIRTSARFAAVAVGACTRRRGLRQRQHASDATTCSGRHRRPLPATPRRPLQLAPRIKLAVNPWTGSAVNANVAKVVLESKLGTPTTLVDLDENAAWVGLDSGELDANLEIWPSGHAADHKTYIEEKKSVVDLGKLGPSAKIGWYVPTFVIDQHPELTTWEGFKDPDVGQAVRHGRVGRPGPVPDG